MESSKNKDLCPLLSDCRLIIDNAERMPELVYRMKTRFCGENASQCARLWLGNVLGHQHVPGLMLPNQWEWAHQIEQELRSDLDGAADDTSCPANGSI